MKRVSYINFLVISFLLMNLAVYAEMPLQPSLEYLCKESSLIVAGEPQNLAVRDGYTKEGYTQNLVEFKGSGHVAYQIMNFKITKIYKGTPDTDPDKAMVIDKSQAGKIINVIFQVRWKNKDYRVPTYKQGGRYILFLEKTSLQMLYTRSEIDSVWEETLWDEQKDKMIQEIIKSLGQQIADNINYAIPENASEKDIPLRPLKNLTFYYSLIFLAEVLRKIISIHRKNCFLALPKDSFMPFVDLFVCSSRTSAVMRQ